MNVGEIETRAGLVGDGVGEVGTTEAQTSLGVEFLFLVDVALVIVDVVDVTGDVVFLVIAIDAAVIAVFIVCHCLAFR